MENKEKMFEQLLKECFINSFKTSDVESNLFLAAETMDGGDFPLFIDTLLEYGSNTEDFGKIKFVGSLLVILNDFLGKVNRGEI